MSSIFLYLSAILSDKTMDDKFMYINQIWLICLKTNIIDEKFGHYYKPANERIKLWELGFSDKWPLERKKDNFYRFL